MFAPNRGLLQTEPMNSALILIVLILLGGGLWQVLRLRRSATLRQQAIRQILDAADALEARLRAARGEIEAIAGDHTNPVQAAMQDLLRQRLWLQDNALSASLPQLENVRHGLVEAGGRLEQQLQQLQHARSGAV